MNIYLVPIWKLSQMIPNDIPLLIQIGYEQADSNEEGTVDLDDAIRILMEREHPDMAPESSNLYGTMLRIQAQPGWSNEFKILI